MKRKAAGIMGEFRWKLIFFLIFTTYSYASSPAMAVIDGLQTGDLLLESLPCRVCQLIEQEEGVPYSHVGIVVNSMENSGRPIVVLESWQSVRATPLAEFLARRTHGTRTLILRPKNFRTVSSEAMLRVFHDRFEGLDYDEAFLWGNSNEKGELLYCSEFVAKLMNVFLRNPLMPKPMHYQKNRALWIRYFRGDPPDGLMGNSPGDFLRVGGFLKVGEI
jgi:Permuted papain-like amidase enzyme, YaeF/YiiX, C92 family